MDMIKKEHGSLIDAPIKYSEDYMHFLCDVIDKFLDIDEQVIAEAIGALFYRRSKEIFEREKFTSSNMSANEKNKIRDGSNYGADYYKYLGYRFVIQTKRMVEEINIDRDPKKCFNYFDMLRVLYGPEDVKRCINNPIANNFS
jgi:hypothetical protein